MDRILRRIGKNYKARAWIGRVDWNPIEKFSKIRPIREPRHKAFLIWKTISGVNAGLDKYTLISKSTGGRKVKCKNV